MKTSVPAKAWWNEQPEQKAVDVIQAIAATESALSNALQSINDQIAKLSYNTDEDSKTAMVTLRKISAQVKSSLEIVRRF